MAQRGAYAKGVAKREEILDAALAVVATHGFRNASVREIAGAAGLSPAGLLHYFGSKEELFVTILRARDERDVREVRAAGDARAADEHDFLELFLDVIRHNATVPGLVLLYTRLAAEASDPQHPARAYFRERTEALTEGNRDLIVRAQEAGEIRADVDPRWVIRSLIALADGLQAAWLIDPTIDMAADIEEFLRLLRPSQDA